MIVLEGQVDWHGCIIDRVRGQPVQTRFFVRRSRFRNRLNPYNQGLVPRQIHGLVRHDDLSVEMGVYGNHKRLFEVARNNHFQYDRNGSIRSSVLNFPSMNHSSLPALRGGETIQGRLHQRRRAPEIRSPEPVNSRREIHQPTQGSFTQNTQRTSDPHAALSGDTAR